MLRLSLQAHRDPVGAAAMAATPAPQPATELVADAGGVLLRGWLRPFPNATQQGVGTIWKNGILGDLPVEVRAADEKHRDVRWMSVADRDHRTLRATVIAQREAGLRPVVVTITGERVASRGIVA